MVVGAGGVVGIGATGCGGEDNGAACIDEMLVCPPGETPTCELPGGEPTRACVSAAGEPSWEPYGDSLPGCGDDATPFCFTASGRSSAERVRCVPCPDPLPLCETALRVTPACGG